MSGGWKDENKDTENLSLKDTSVLRVDYIR